MRTPRAFAALAALSALVAVLVRLRGRRPCGRPAGPAVGERVAISAMGRVGYLGQSAVVFSHVRRPFPGVARGDVLWALKWLQHRHPALALQLEIAPAERGGVALRRTRLDEPSNAVEGLLVWHGEGRDPLALCRDLLNDQALGGGRAGGPLWRLHVVAGRDWIFAGSHAVMDAAGQMTMLRDLFAQLRTAVDKRELPKSLPALPPIDDLLTPQPVTALVGALVGTWTDFYAGHPSIPLRSPDARFEPTNDLIVSQGDASSLDAVLSRCREEGISANAVMAAAVFFAVYRARRPGPGRSKAITVPFAVNLRSRVDPPIDPSAVMDAAINGEVSHSVGNEPARVSLWGVARAFHQQTQALLRAQEPQRDLQILRVMTDVLPDAIRFIERQKEASQTGRMGDVNMSNLGIAQLDDPKASCFHFVDTVPRASMLVHFCAASVAGHGMSYTMAWLPSLLDREAAESILHDIRGIFESAHLYTDAYSLADAL